MISTQAVIIFYAVLYGLAFGLIWSSTWVGIVGFAISWAYITARQPKVIEEK